MQSVEDQSVKASGVGIRKAPAQMESTGGTKRHLPDCAGEPGKIRGGRSDGGAAGCGGKAADLEDKTMRVGKNLAMRAANRDTPAFGGDRLSTQGATEGPGNVGAFGVRRGGMLDVRRSRRFGLSGRPTRPE